jgi:serine/threonine protein phosphatase PrpC
MKQETLEEVAKEFFRKFKHTHSPDNYYLALVEFTKWQQERMYSEEDLKDAFFEGWIARDGKLTFTKAKSKWFKELKTNKI